MNATNIICVIGDVEFVKDMRASTVEEHGEGNIRYSTALESKTVNSVDFQESAN